jgi:hypothetical protein
MATNSSQNPITREDAWKQLSNAYALRTSHDHVIWMIFSAFWAAIALLLVALFQTGRLPIPPIGFVVSMVGFAVSVAWILIHRRTTIYIERYESVVKYIEDSVLQLPRNVSLQPPPQERFWRWRFPRGRQVANAFSYCSAIGWLIARAFLS